MYFWPHQGVLTVDTLRRRDVLLFGALAVAMSLTPGRANAHPRRLRVPTSTARRSVAPAVTTSLSFTHQPTAPQPQIEVPEKALVLYNTNTGETLNTVYWCHGTYLPEALQAINYLLRDHHTDTVVPIDLQLLDLLHTLGQTLEVHEVFHVRSGYRSPATNAWLRRRSRRVAKNSLHTVGKAVDLYLPGCALTLVHRAAVALQAGGVGYYPAAHFIHIDTGPVRFW